MRESSRSQVEISKSNFPCVFVTLNANCLLPRTVFCEIYTIDSLRVVDRLSVLNLGRYEQRESWTNTWTVFSDNVANSDAINVNCPRNIWQLSPNRALTSRADGTTNAKPLSVFFCFGNRSQAGN